MIEFYQANFASGPIMRLLRFIIFVLICLHSLPAQSKDWNAVCGALAKAVDENRLKDIILRYKQDKEISIDIDNDGHKEQVQFHYRTITVIDDNITYERLSYEGPHSSFDSRRLIYLDNKYYFIEVERGVLSTLWELTSTVTSNGKRSTPVRCVFDREWMPMPDKASSHSICSRLLSGQFERSTFPKVRSSSAALQINELNEFVPKLHAMSLKRISDALSVDIDNDGEKEIVFMALLHLGNLGLNQTYRYVPIISTENGSGLPIPDKSLQNLTLMSGVSSGRDSRSDISGISIVEANGEIFVEDRHLTKPFWGAPSIPFWRIYQLRGEEFAETCRFEFAWKTKYRIAGGVRP